MKTKTPTAPSRTQGHAKLRADALYQRALQSNRNGQPEEAMRLLRDLLVLDPRHCPALNLLSILRQQAGELEEGLRLTAQSLKLDPRQPLALNSRGLALRALGRDEEALASFDQALALKPDYAVAWCNRALVLEGLGRIGPALESYERAIEHKPDHAIARSNKALLELLLGRYEAGWNEYEWRWQSSLAGQARTFSQPQWTGDEPLAGRTILLHAEQGMGDTIQFSRYVPRVAALADRVILEVQPPLLPLLASQAMSCRTIAAGEPLPDFDVVCPLLSLPRAFRTTLATVPATTPYLAVDPARRDRWRDILGPATRPRVGLAWSGSVQTPSDRSRSIALRVLTPLLHPAIEWHAVQKDVRSDDLETMVESGRMAWHGGAIEDFADTAALIDAMDLVISVDSAPAHLAGALGKPLWVLLQAQPDFRWLLERDDSPWYPSARLFRQARAGDWSEVIAAVGDRLRARFPVCAETGAAHVAASPASAFDEHAWLQQAVRLHAEGNRVDATHTLRWLLLRRPDHREALNLLSQCQLEADQPEEALRLVERSLALDPQQAEVLNTRGMAMRKAGRLQEALESFERALALAPDDATLHANRGFALQELGRMEASLESHERSLALEPGQAPAHANRGVLLRELGRHAEAVSAFETALALDPQDATTQFDQAIARIALGDFERGWAQYEWRFKAGKVPSAKSFAEPLWLGDFSLAGRTILLQAEQGLGDTIQFCRYAPMVEALGARVLMGVLAPLVPLLRTLPGSCEVFHQGEYHFDAHCPLLSLPHAFKTTVATIPAAVPYLRVDPSKRAQWRKRLGTASRPRVGLAWSGSKQHARDAQRSLSLSQIAPLLSLDVEWHAVQKDIRDDDLRGLRESGRVRLHSAALHDFADAAALVDAMDLVISVDSVPAHLAGALGKPVWILLPFFPDYRWLLERSDTPWYPTATLFRQTRRDEWGEVIATVADRLRSGFSRR